LKEEELKPIESPESEVTVPFQELMKEEQTIIITENLTRIPERKKSESRLKYIFCEFCGMRLTKEASFCVQCGMIIKK